MERGWTNDDATHEGLSAQVVGRRTHAASPFSPGHARWPRGTGLLDSTVRSATCGARSVREIAEGPRKDRELEGSLRPLGSLLRRGSECGADADRFVPDLVRGRAPKAVSGRDASSGRASGEAQGACKCER